MSVMEFIFRKAGEVFNFTKDRLGLAFSLGIWKIFRILQNPVHLHIATFIIMSYDDLFY